MQRGDQAEVVQHRRAQFAGEAVHDVHGMLHQLLRAGDVAVQTVGVDGSLLGQRRQPDVDAGEGLGDDIVQLAADLAAFLLLGGENLAGQLPQLFLHEIRLLQQLRVMTLALLERRLHRLALGDLQAQLLVGGGQHLDAALRLRRQLALGDVVKAVDRAGDFAAFVFQRADVHDDMDPRFVGPFNDHFPVALRRFFSAQHLGHGTLCVAQETAVRTEQLEGAGISVAGGACHRLAPP